MIIDYSRSSSAVYQNLCELCHFCPKILLSEKKVTNFFDAQHLNCVQYQNKRACSIRHMNYLRISIDSSTINISQIDLDDNHTYTVSRAHARIEVNEKNEKI